MEGDDDQEQKDLTTAILVFAHYLGIDLDEEQDLIHIAEEAFDNLPPAWEFGIGEGEHAGIPYFYNTKTNQSEWKHPEEQIYMKMVQKERAQRKEKQQKRNNREQQPEPEVVEVEDFEDPDYPSRKQGNSNNSRRNDNRNDGNSRDSRDRGGKSNKSGFGMTEEDFLDEDPGEYSYGQKRNNTETRDRDNSPPMFKDPKLMSADSPDQKFPNNSNANTRNVQLNLNSATTSSALSNPVPANRINRKGTETNTSTNQNATTTLQSLEDRSHTLQDRDSSRMRDSRDNRDGRESRESRDYSTGRGSRDYRDNRDIRDSRNDYNRSDRDRDRNGGRDTSRGRGGYDDRDRGRDRAREDVRDGEETIDNRALRDDRDRVRSGRNDSPNGRAKEGRIEKLEMFDAEPNPVSGSNAASTREVEELRRKKEEALDQLAMLKTQHQNDATKYKEELRQVEEKLHEERRQRKQLEETLAFHESQMAAKTREMDDLYELKIREQSRKIRGEIEEEMKEKLRNTERHATNEQDNLRLEIQTIKRKNEELDRDNENLKRKIFLSKEDGKAEVNIEINNLRQGIRELEDEDRRKSTDLRALREENAALQGKLAMTIQAMQASTIEVENAKIQRHQAAQEVELQLQNNLMYQQRISRLEQDFAHSKAEAMVVKKEKENMEVDLRKLQSIAVVSGDQLSASESESRRLKSKTQAEISRLTSRVIELDAMVTILKEQLDKASDSEHQAVKKVMSQVENLDIENRRYKDRLSDMTMKVEEYQLKVKNLEKDIFDYQETVYKKDKALREEQLNQEKYKDSIESIRKNYEDQLAMIQETYRKEVVQREHMIQSHEEEMAKLQQEVNHKVPKMVQVAIEKAEINWQAQNQQQLEDLQLGYENQISKLKAELSNIQTYYTEKEAKQKLATADERVELDKLRNSQMLLNRDKEDLEDENNKLKKQNRQFEHQVQSLELNAQELNKRLQQVMSSRQTNNQSLVQFTNNNAVSNTPNRPNTLFHSLLQKSFESQPQPPPPPPSFPVQDMSMNQTYMQDTSSMINQDAMFYLSQQLSQMKAQVQESLQPHQHAHKKNVSFTPESLYPTPNDHYHRVNTKLPLPANRAAAVQELLRDEFEALPSREHTAREEDHSNALWHRHGMSQAHNSTFLADRDNSMMSHIPNYETKETDRSSQSLGFAPNRARGSDYLERGAKNRYDSNSAASSVNNSYLGLESLLEPNSSVFESSTMELVSDGGYYEGYWKAKYTKSK